MKEKILENLIPIWQKEHRKEHFPTEGKSMYPLIKHGDTICVEFMPPNELKQGNIIALRRDNTTIAHRLIKKDKNKFLEKGDFQLKGQLIEPNQIMGKVILVSIGIDPLLGFLGYTIHLLSPVRIIAKIVLTIPFILNHIQRWKNTH